MSADPSIWRLCGLVRDVPHRHDENTSTDPGTGVGRSMSLPEVQRDVSRAFEDIARGGSTGALLRVSTFTSILVCVLRTYVAMHTCLRCLYTVRAAAFVRGIQF